MRCSRTEAPSLRRRYPASPVLRASPPPCAARPDPRGLSVGVCYATGRASRVASIPLLHTCRRHYPGGTGRCSRRSLPDRWQPSPYSGRVGFRITRFEACAAFTRVAARVVAEPPWAALCRRSASADVVTSIVRPDCYRLERQLPGGIRTRCGMAPCHGAPDSPVIGPQEHGRLPAGTGTRPRPPALEWPPPAPRTLNRRPRPTQSDGAPMPRPLCTPAKAGLPGGRPRFSAVRAGPLWLT